MPDFAQMRRRLVMNSLENAKGITGIADSQQITVTFQNMTGMYGILTG